MTATAKKPRPIERGLLAKIHIAKKDLALDDDSYRALVLRVAGQESCKGLAIGRLEAVLAEFKSLGWKARRKSPPRRAGARAMARDHEAPKIRALWLSLYHLGEIGDPSEAALARYAARMTKSPGQPDGVQALQFLDAAAANRVIKALRGWCRRIGFEQPKAERIEKINKARAQASLAPADTGLAAKMALLDAQWERLRALEAFREPVFANLGSWLARNYGPAHAWWLDAEAADRAIEALGGWIRKQTSEDREQKVAAPPETGVPSDD